MHVCTVLPAWLLSLIYFGRDCKWHHIASSEQSIISDRYRFTKTFHSQLLIVMYLLIPLVSLCEVILILLSEYFTNNSANSHHHYMRLEFRVFLTIAVIVFCMGDLSLILLVAYDEAFLIFCLSFFSFLQILITLPLCYRYYCDKKMYFERLPASKLKLLEAV